MIEFVVTNLPSIAILTHYVRTKYTSGYNIISFENRIKIKTYISWEIQISQFQEFKDTFSKLELKKNTCIANLNQKSLSNKDNYE